ncbi:MAG: hypothetical protein JRH11_26880, partial [Deltaproteobacteria bacterium]|nr:hypothetical protein [Deltaproteobacteria bacterium]
PTSGVCVACIGDSDCDDVAAAQCDTTAGTCGACDSDMACIGRTGTLVCAPQGPNEGACVECSAAARDACDLAPSTERNVCDANTNTCTAEAPASANTCSPCVSDVQCQPGQLCVATEFNADAAMTPVDGFFCLWTEGAASPGPAGSCFSNGRPYLRRRPDVTSIDGTVDIVCDLAVSTCPAQNDFRDTRCGDGGAPEMPVDATCGVSTLEDAYCVDGDTGSEFDYRCTTRCLSLEDCDSGSTCTSTNRCTL